MEGNERKSQSREASTSREPLRMEIDEENWTVVKIGSSRTPSPSVNLQRDATTSYATNRETVFHKNAQTVEETHLIKSMGSMGRDYSEEHWSSEIKSYITTQPPKFLQVIKAFRVLPTDTLTLVVEVSSDPPAIFEWFCNDRPVQQDRRRFKARHGINITTLTVEGPEQGVYKCTARNPAGKSTTYGYIIVSAPPQYKNWVEQKHAVVLEEQLQTVTNDKVGVKVNCPPKFINQVPNLTLKPGAEAVIDVEVEASPPAKFTWFVNGFELRDSTGRVETYNPSENRCVARFPIPQTGEYKVVAENFLGRDQSVGYIDIRKEVSIHQMQRPPLPVDHTPRRATTNPFATRELYSTANTRASSVTKTVDVYEESTYYQRSTSLPRPAHSERHVEVATNKDLLVSRAHERDLQHHTSMKEIYRRTTDEPSEPRPLYRTRSETTRYLPQSPIFLNSLPAEINLSSKENLILSVEVKALPQAEIKWNVNGFEVKPSRRITILNEQNHSTLVVQPPVKQGRYSVTAVNDIGMITQTTKVYQEIEEESYEIVDKIVSEERRSLPPEIVENAITVTSATDDWEVVDDKRSHRSSAESFETVKLRDTSNDVIHVDGVREEDETPQPPIKPLFATTSVKKSSEEFLTTEEQDQIAMCPTAQPAPVFDGAVTEVPRRISVQRSNEPLPMRPFMVQQLEKEVFVKAGEKLVLESKVESYPESTFKWFQNNFELKSSSLVQIESDVPNESRAVFHKPTSGVYKVTATNPYGSCSSSTRVVTEAIEEILEETSTSIIRIPKAEEPKFKLMRKTYVEGRKDLPKPPKIIEKFGPVIRIGQQRALALCVEADAIPEATFTWLVNNFQIRQSTNVVFENGPNISKATFMNPVEGRYEVIASNQLGKDSCSTKVIVEYEPVAEIKKPSQMPSLPSIPVFTEPLPAETVVPKNGTEFRLTVSVLAQQPVTYRWFVDGSLLSNSVEHQMINEPMRSSLVVRKAIKQPADYAVEVSNNNGAIWSETRVISRPTQKIRPAVEEFVAVESVIETLHKGPRFIKILPPMGLREAERFSVQVAVDREAAPCKFLWTLNGVDVTTLPGFCIQSNHYESTLFIDSVCLETAGKLTVVAKNEFGSAVSSAVVSVQKKEESYEIITETKKIPAERPPKIVTPLHSAVFRSGQPMVLRCRVDAFPAPQITWTKDEINVEEWVINKDVVTRMLSDGICELMNPECFPDDAGTYKCTARNPHGTAETAAYIAVEGVSHAKDLEEASVSEFTQIISKKTVFEERAEESLRHEAVSSPPIFVEKISKLIEKNRTVIMCKVHSISPVNVAWLKDGKELYQSEKYTIHSLANGTQTLIIREVSECDEGVYTCKAQNRYGISETTTELIIKKEETKTKVEEEVMIEEHTDEQIEPPKTTEYVKKAYVDKSVKVAATEITERKESYSRTAELRKSEEEYKLLVKVAETVARRIVAKVVIDEAIREAVSRIKEEVHSSDEEDTISFDSAVEQQPCPPRFETNIECYTVNVGDTVKLTTDIGGYPAPTVEWYFGEQRIEQSKQIELYYISGRATLIIKKVEKLNEGEYFCKAENDFGKAVLSCNLRVLDTSQGRTESTLNFSKATKYDMSEMETEVFSNIHVNHTQESFDHHVAILQPLTFTLGYDCKASTSKVYDDSLIISKDSVRRASETSKEVAVEIRPLIEEQTVLNVNVEKPPSLFTHEVRVLQSDDAKVSLIGKEKFVIRSEEVIQTAEIQLIETQRKASAVESTENANTTVVIEKPSQRAIHEVTCLYDDRANPVEKDLQAVTSVDIRDISAVNELLSTVVAAKEKHKAHAIANVEVRRPAARFDHTITVVEPEVKHLTGHLTAPTTSTDEIIISEMNVQKLFAEESASLSRTERPVRHAVAEQRIVILEGSQQTFSDAIIWSLKKVRKAIEQSGEAVATASVEVRKPAEYGEHVTTVIDSAKLIPEILAIAAAASKLKITSVFISLTKKGDCAHQALVIQYESFVEDEATLNVSVLTAPGFHSKQEEKWSRRKVDKELLLSQEGEPNVVAVFVEVDACCPDQTVELVASVNIPVISNANLLSARKSSSSLMERSVSLTESSSTGGLQMPKFFKKLEDATVTVGQPHQFKCIVSGMPMPEVRWFVDGDEIHDSTEYETVYEDGVCILRIKELVLEDEGEYICEATNEVGRSVTKCFLRTTSPLDDGSCEYYRKNESEEISSHITFEPEPAADSFEIQMTLAKEREEACPLEVACRAEANQRAAFEEHFVEEDLSLYSEFLSVETARTFITAPKERTSVSFYFGTNEVYCSFGLKRMTVFRASEITWADHCCEQAEVSCSVSASKLIAVSCDLFRPDSFEEATFFKLVSADFEVTNNLFFSLSEQEFAFHRRQIAELDQNIIPETVIKNKNLSAVGISSSVEISPPRDFAFMSTVHTYLKCKLGRENSYESANVTVISKVPLSSAASRIDLDLSGSDLWNEKFENPFFQESENAVASEESRLYEPRTPLLPQKVTYKGQEIDVSVREIERLAPVPSFLNEEPDTAIIQKCVEEIFDFDSTIDIIMAENLTSFRPEKNKKQVVAVHELQETIEISSEVIQPIENEGFQKENAVITEEDYEMLDKELGVSCESTEVAPEMHEESEYVGYVFRKNSQYGEAVENRGIEIPSPSDISQSPEFLDDVSSSTTPGNTSYLRKSSDPKDTNFLVRIKEIEKIAKQVEAELGSTSGRSVEPQEAVPDENALQIEQAIFDISEKMAHYEPITEAQAEASEELFKATLEDIITHLPSGTKREDATVYKKPIAFLKQKLTDLENSLMVDEEVEVIMNNAEDQGPSSQENGQPRASNTLRKETKKVVVKRMSQEFARVTPITTNIQEQLTTLETMLDEEELTEESILEETTEETKLLPYHPTAKHKEVHGVLMQINNEINTIKRYCHKNISQRGVDAVVGVLNKVRGHVGSIIDVISLSKRRHRTRSPEKHRARTGYFFPTDASINFIFMKPQADEAIDVTVMYKSSSEKNSGHNSQQSESSPYQYDYKFEKSSTDVTSASKADQIIVLEHSQEAKLLEEAQITEIQERPPVAPPRARKASQSKRDDDAPIPPPRPKRRSRSRDDKEKMLAEMLSVQTGTEESLGFRFHDGSQTDGIAFVEIRKLQDALNENLEQFGPYELVNEGFGHIREESICRLSEQAAEASEEFFIRRKNDCGDDLLVLSAYHFRRVQLNIFDETSSVQLVCEESDYGNDSDTASHLIAKRFPSRVQEPPIEENNEKNLQDELAQDIIGEDRSAAPSVNKDSSGDPTNRNEAKTLEISEKYSISSSDDTEEIEVEVVLNQCSESLNGTGVDFIHSLRTKSAKSPKAVAGAFETNSLHESESICEKEENYEGREDEDEEYDNIRVICRAAPGVTDLVNIMPTIMERSETSNRNSSATTVSGSTSATSTTTTGSIIQRYQHPLQISCCDLKDVIVANRYVMESQCEESKDCVFACFGKGRAINADEEAYDANIEETNAFLNWRCRFQKYRVIAELFPDVRIALQAAVAVDEEAVEVVVEQPSEVQGYQIRIVDSICDAIQLSVVEMTTSSVSVEISLGRDEDFAHESVVAVQNERLRTVNGEEKISNTASNEDLEALPSEDAVVCISVVARSVNDAIYASLEEIPWGEVSMHIVEPEMIRSLSDSENRSNSLIQNVTVSESNENERKSLRSQESFRSSQKSLALSDRTDQFASNQSLNIPSYVLREGSTATITCELNNFLNPESVIFWYKGKKLIDSKPGKIDRISHDLLEVLVISHVELSDSDIYSIQVNDEVYPVACLIVEEEASDEKVDREAVYLSPPQTMFVMEGQPSIIACQTSVPFQSITWSKDRKLLEPNDRIKFESDEDGFHRVIIASSVLEDQGTYYAYLGSHFTTITLVVEERIDEKEVTVAASGTESEDDDFREYIVPPGSTATIACELEKSDEVRELVWRKDGVNIIFNDDTKLEHVVNGLKHYLVIHDTQPSDSACYSVRINDIEFKVAHMSVSDYATSIAGKRAKRISNSSLQHA